MSAQPEGDPMYGQCSACAHVWVICYLPLPLMSLHAALGDATCGKCGCTDVHTHQPSQSPENELACYGGA